MDLALPADVAPRTSLAPVVGFAAQVGSVAGAEHVRLGRNNQDGWAVEQGGGFAVAVVTDGCSSGEWSEVGARLGARVLARQALALARALGLSPALPERAADALLGFLAGLAGALDAGGDGLADEVGRQLLFTFQCAVYDGERALVFGVGDGVWAVDGQACVLESGPDNAPAYLAYRLVPADRLPPDFDATRDAAVRTHHLGPARTVALATDGFAHALASNPRALASALEDPAGWRNRFALQRRLNVLGAQARGALPDDTTLVLLRAEGAS